MMLFLSVTLFFLSFLSLTLSLVLFFYRSVYDIPFFFKLPFIKKFDLFKKKEKNESVNILKIFNRYSLYLTNG